MFFPVYAHLSSSPATMSPKTMLKRPRGLWKAARDTPKPSLDPHPPQKRPRSDDHCNRNRTARHPAADNPTLSDGDCCDSDSSTNSSSKRFRYIDSSEEDTQDEVIFWDYSRKCSSQPDRVSKWSTRSKLMDTSSTAGPGQSRQLDPTPTFTLEDWQDLKELFSKAVDLYENQEPSETIPFLRGVIHECHRFMKAYQDPSTLFAPPVQVKRSSIYTPPEQKVISEWLPGNAPIYPPAYDPLNLGGRQTSPPKPTNIEPEKKCKCKDLPTALHTVFGTTLFLFGNLIAQDHSLALQGEPTTPTPYWFSAIDVFQMGESLPIRVSGRGCPSAPEDWRMAVVWGRTLVNLADEILTREKASSSTPVPTPLFPSPLLEPQNTFTSTFFPRTNSADEPKWPADSPFGLIATRRLPSSFRINLNVSTPHELLQLAQDQFYRGIFHMPHHRGLKAPRGLGAQSSKRSRESQSSSVDPPIKTPLSLSLAGNTFSRAKELYTIGSEVLLLSEKLDAPSERCHWAKWADGIFGQMRMETNSPEETWKVPLTISRGRASLVMGSAMAEEMENELERGEMQVLDSEEAEDARDALQKAVNFLDKARELVSSDAGEVLISGASAKAAVVDFAVEGEDEEIQAAIFDEDSTSVVMASEEETPEQAEIRTLLAEALLTLANLTADEVEREALYAKAHQEGRGSFELDDDRMDESG